MQPSLEFLRSLIFQVCARTADRRGTISYEEFLNYFDFDKSLFVKRAFDVMDEDASGAIVRSCFVLFAFWFSSTER